MSSLYAAWTLLTQASRSNPSFINRDARVQEQVVENEGKDEDVETGQLKDEIEEVPRVVDDTGYVLSFPLNSRELTQSIE